MDRIKSQVTNGNSVQGHSKDSQLCLQRAACYRAQRFICYTTRPPYSLVCFLLFIATWSWVVVPIKANTASQNISTEFMDGVANPLVFFHNKTNQTDVGSSEAITVENTVLSFRRNLDESQFSSDISPEKKKKTNFSFLSRNALIIFGSVCAAMIIACIWLFCCRKTNRLQPSEIILGSRDYHSPEYSMDEISKATGDYSDEKRLGKGGTAVVYRADFPNGNKAAVKRFLKTGHDDFKAYQKEVAMVHKLDHPNIVKVKGWCYKTNQEYLVVYDFMENGSLADHLFSSGNKPLSWEVRYKIAYDMAVALRYLHHECSRCVLHRDIKSDNILLDGDKNAKLGDFGFAKVLDSTQSSKVPFTAGYLAPECFHTGEFTRASDVYSYGVVLLEIVTGRKVYDKNRTEDEKELVKWAKNVDNSLQSSDPKVVLKNVADPRLCGEYNQQQMMKLMAIGLQCVSENVESRLSMEKVVGYLH